MAPNKVAACNLICFFLLDKASIKGSNDSSALNSNSPTASSTTKSSLSFNNSINSSILLSISIPLKFNKENY